MSARRGTIDDEANEGYFASVSDLMVGVLFVFLIMLTFFALQFKSSEEEQMVERATFVAAEQAAQAARAQAEAESQKSRVLRDLLAAALAQLQRDTEDRLEARTRMLDEIERGLAARNVRATIDRESGVLRLGSDLLFEVRSAAATPTAGDTFRSLADVLQRVLPCYSVATGAARCDKQSEPILEAVLVEGHTDRQAFLNDPDGNDRLSAERALSVIKEMRRDHPALESLQNVAGTSLIGISGYGPRRPVAGALGDTPADFARNRRIDVRFVLATRTSTELQRLRARIESVLGSGP